MRTQGRAEPSAEGWEGGPGKQAVTSQVAVDSPACGSLSCYNCLPKDTVVFGVAGSSGPSWITRLRARELPFWNLATYNTRCPCSLGHRLLDTEAVSPVGLYSTLRHPTHRAGRCFSPKDCSGILWINRVLLQRSDSSWHRGKGPMVWSTRI